MSQKTLSEKLKTKGFLVAETGDGFALAYPSRAKADEKARRKSFAARIFGPNATHIREMAPYLFFAYDNRTAELDAVLLRKIIMKG